MSRWRKRNVSSASSRRRSGRISSLRTRAMSWAGRASRPVSGVSSDTSSRRNSLPTTAARSIVRRSGSARRSSRAASSACMVGGTVIASRSPTASDPVRAPAHRAVVEEHLDDLLDVERVPVGRGGDPRPGLGGDGRAFEQGLDEPLGLGLGERLETERGRVGLAATPAGARVEEVRAGHCQEQDRDAARPVGDVLDEIEQRRFGPLEVVEDDDDGSDGRQALEAAAGPPRRARRS